MNGNLRKLFFVTLSCVSCTIVPSFGVAISDGIQEWNFRVLLDDSEIGHHRYTLTDLGNGLEMRTEAQFNVRFLLIPIYRYRHVNTERWDEECLEAIESQTNANGEAYSVSGAMRDRDLLLSLTANDIESRSTLSGCVMSFAYWDPDVLRQPRLLNTQTGEYVEVSVASLGEDVINVRGQSVSAMRYRLDAQELSIELWYSSDQEWLALESTTEGGRRIRYELT